MGNKLNIKSYLNDSKERDKAKWKYEYWDDECQSSSNDYNIYNSILDRIYSKYIKLHAANYERMLYIKKYKVDNENMIASIICDSIEINSNKVTFQNDITIKFDLTDDCELLYWTYESLFRLYDISDWTAFTMKALKLIN